MGVRLGLDCKMYYNDGTYAEPDWIELDNAKDVTLNLEKGEADVSRRRSKGWREFVGTLKDASVEFQSVYDSEDDNFQMLQDSFLNHTPVEFLILDGDVEEEGNQGLRVTMEVFGFSRNEALEEAVMVDVNIKPTPAANAPEWFVVPGE